jgi:hypothetical protein
MMKKPVALGLAFAILTGCAGNPQKESDEAAAERSHGGKIVGATGGAVGGAAMAYSSAGILCTIGGPLCAIMVIPAAIVGGLIGGAAGSVVDAVSDSRAGGARDPAPPRADTSARPGG